MALTSAPARYEIFDRSFADLVEPGAPLLRLVEGCLWAEGPVWLSREQCLVFSDVRRNRLLRCDEMGHLALVRQPSNFSNGNTVDGAGRLVTCEHGTRRVVRTEGGTEVVVADNWHGRRLNSPNDVVAHSDGSVWFSDPTYGIDGFDEGYPAVSEVGGCHVYRVDLDGNVDAVITDMVQPNGLAFSRDESVLYVVDSGRTHHPDGPRHVRRFEVVDGRCTGGEVLADAPAGIFDGIRIDDGGRLWIGCGSGVFCCTAGGAPLGVVSLPEACANLEFGGRDGRTLFMTATTSVYALRVSVRGGRA